MIAATPPMKIRHEWRNPFSSAGITADATMTATPATNINDENTMLLRFKTILPSSLDARLLSIISMIVIDLELLG